MKQVLLVIAGLCMAAAICEQLMDGSRFFPAIRLVLGLEIASVVVSGAIQAWEMLNG